MGITPMLQFMTWKEATGSDRYGPTYTDHLLVPCNFVEEYKVIKKALGNGTSTDVASVARLRTDARVQGSDKIIFDSITYPVVSVRSIPGPGSEIIEYEVRL